MENHPVIAMTERAFIGQDTFVVWGTGKQIRNWAYICDNVQGMIMAAENIDDGPGVNLGTIERIKALDTVREVLRCTGRQAPLELHPEMPTGPHSRVADNRLAKKLLGWEPEENFFDGLRRTIDWYFATHQEPEVNELLEEMLIGR